MHGKAFITRSIVNEDLSFVIFPIPILNVKQTGMNFEYKRSSANNHATGRFVENPDDLAAGMYKVVVITSSSDVVLFQFFWKDLLRIHICLVLQQLAGLFPHFNSVIFQ